MSCSCHSSGQTVLQGLGRVGVQGSGTASDPYIISESDAGGTLQFEVRDSATVNLTLFGSGTVSDPYIIKADTSSASALLGLSDVSPTPGVQQGAVPVWIGSVGGGHFEMRLPGVRYTTHATRGPGLYQGEVIRETDTGTRFEWDGSQYIDLTPTVIPPTALDPSIVQNAGTLDPSTNWNTLTVRGGVYRVANFASNVNGPSGAYNYGTLVVFVSGSSVTQSYWTHNAARLYQRTKYNDSDWTGWTAGAIIDDVANARNDLGARIDQNRTDFTNGDNALRQSLGSEATTRSNADNDLSNRLAQEIRDRSDSVGQLRSDATGADNDIRNRLGNLEASNTPGFTLRAGDWQVNRANFWRAGRVVQMDLSLTRRGATIAAGNITNIAVGDVTGGFGSAGFAPLTGGPGGSPISAYVSGTGVYLAATTAQIANGDELTLVGTWIMS